MNNVGVVGNRVVKLGRAEYFWPSNHVNSDAVRLKLKHRIRQL